MGWTIQVASTNRGKGCISFSKVSIAVGYRPRSLKQKIFHSLFCLKTGADSFLQTQCYNFILKQDNPERA